MERHSTKEEGICREIPYRFYNLITTFKPVLGTLTIISSLPALTYGCSEPTPSYQAVGLGHIAADSLEVRSSGDSEPLELLDVFIYNKDRTGRLDSYQRFKEVTGQKVSIASRSGEKHIIAYGNVNKETYRWDEICSIASIREVKVHLEEERASHPAMSGEISIEAGRDADTPLQLSPVSSSVLLRSVSCNFKGTPYAGEKMSDVKVYLINVNAECHLNGQENGMPGRIINAGRLNPDDLENFIEPGLIVRDIEGKIGERRIYPDINLRCYSNSSAEESPGSPSTMLVIEGSIDGSRWFYPITVNRTDQNRGHSHTGIGRNCRYIYDITILRKGSSSPDIPVDPDAVRTEFNIKPWHTTDEYEICF